MHLDRTITGTAVAAANLPRWVPESVRHYLMHVSEGRSLRDVAGDGSHASTILRHVRRWEARRDDPLVDSGLEALANLLVTPQDQPAQDRSHMSRHVAPEDIATEDDTKREARRILRRLCETGAFLAVTPELGKAAVLRQIPGGEAARIAVVERRFVQAFLLKDWIERRSASKRVACYEISHAGRAALKRILAETNTATAPDAFRAQHADWEDREVRDRPGGQPKRMRYNLAESPLTALGRRRDADGKLFLVPELVRAGEMLREDFELAQMGPRVTQNWDRFLVGGRGGDFCDRGPAEGPRAARERVAAALRDLGPGLGDIALRCCCFLEGLETAEKRMGWSARSGKIVLRIALQRLRQHYEAVHGPDTPKIG